MKTNNSTNTQNSLTTLVVYYVNGNWDFVQVSEEEAQRLLEHTPYMYGGEEIDQIVRF